MPQSESLAKFTEAMAKARSEFKPLKKNAINPFFAKKEDPEKGRYSDLSAVIEATEAALSNNGLILTQDTETNWEHKSVIVTTTIFHSSGEWKEYRPLEVPVKQFDAQGVGGAQTYGRRYGQVSALNLAADPDDDGNLAAGRTNGDALEQNKPTQPTQSSAPRTAAKKSAPKAEAPKPEVKKEEPKATESKEDTRTPQEKLRDEVRVIMGNASLNIKGADIKTFIVKESGNEKHASNDKFRLEDLSNDEAQKVYAKIAEAAKADKLADLFKGESK